MSRYRWVSTFLITLIAAAALVVSGFLLWLVAGGVAARYPKEEEAPPSRTAGEPRDGAVASSPAAAATFRPVEAERGEERLANLRMLTFTGENAEAYFNAAGDRLVFQSRQEGEPGDQVYTMNLEGGDRRRVSTGAGVCTCAYFADHDRRVIFSSTHLAGPGRPPEVFLPGHRYTWTVFAEFDIFSAAPDGGDLKRLTDTPGYDAEGTLSPDGKTILFTSMRDGDLDLYTMDLNGESVRRLTDMPGYDGGAFFSPDGKKIVWRGRHGSEEELAEYRDLLKKNKVAPGVMDLYVADADGANARMILSNGASNWCPSFHPSGTWIIFSSNVEDLRAREAAKARGEEPPRGAPNFDLYRVDLDGSNLARITTYDGFDGFPVFSHDGRRLVWQSNRRHRPGTRETNVFIADWRD
ncbi:MAG: TolB family protein [Planctomycetes bacterium]|nr:TolB family protein [Planctomycetota bacterium]